MTKITKLPLITITLLVITTGGMLYSQVMVQFTTPPSNYRTFSDLWNLSINNISGLPFQFNAELTLTENTEGAVLTGRIQNIQLPAGLTLFSAENFNLSNISFSNHSLANSLKTTGLIPAGNYSLCMVLTNISDGMELGRTCTGFSVLQSVTDPGTPSGGLTVSKYVQFHGFAEATMVWSNTPGNFTNMPASYSQLIVNPTISLFDVPVNARFTLSTLNSSQSQNINAFTLNFDGDQFKNVLKNKLIDMVTKNNKIKDMNLSGLKGSMGELANIKNTLQNPDVIKELTQLKELDSLKKKLSEYKDIEKWKEKGVDSLQKWGAGWKDSLHMDTGKIGIFRDSLIHQADSLKEKGVMYKDSIAGWVEKVKNFNMEGSVEDNISSITQKIKGMEWLEQKREGYEKLLKKKDDLIAMGQKFGLIDSTGNVKDVNALKEKLDISKLSDPNVLYDKLKNSKLLRKMDKFLYGFKTLSIGLANPDFSDLSLKGVPVRGIFVEYEFKNFHASFTHGELQTGVYSFNATSASYTRHVTGGSFGYGQKTRTHIYFTLLHIKDDTTSIHPRDSIFISQKTPKENYVMSVDFKISLFKDRFRISGELSGAQHTRDIGSPASPIINPLPGYTEQEWFVNIFGQRQVNLNTTVDFAFLTKVEGMLFKGKTQISATAKRVGPNYYSLGTPFLMRDVFSLEAKVSQRLWKNRIQLMAFVRRNTDNLADQKPMQSSFYNYGFDVTINIPKLPYFKANLLPVNMMNDSMKIDMLIFNASTGYNYTVKKGIVGATNLNYTFQDIQYSDSATYSTGHFITLSQLFTFNNKININLVGSYFQTSNDSLENHTFTIGGGTGFVLFKKLNTSVGGNMYLSQRELKWGAYLQAGANFLKYFNISIRVENNMYNNYIIQPLNPDYQQVLCRTILTARW